MRLERDSEYIRRSIISFLQEYGLILAVAAVIFTALVILLVVLVVIYKKKKKKTQAGNDYAGLDQQLRNQRLYNGGMPQGYPQAPGNVPPQAYPYVSGNMPPQAYPYVQGNVPPQAYPYVPGNVPPQAYPQVQVNVPPQGAPAASANGYTPMTGNAQPSGLMAGSASPVPEREKTHLLSHAQPAVSEHKVTLTSMADPGKIYACRIMDRIVIGRNPACCDIAIPTDNAVSERHCEISYTDNRFYIRDTGSSNGTSINGCIVGSVTQIRPGDVVKIGRIEYRITLE